MAAMAQFERLGGTGVVAFVFYLRVQIVCTVLVTERAALCEEALDDPGVVGVRELATGERNVIVTVVGEDGDDLTRTATELVTSSPS